MSLLMNDSQTTIRALKDLVLQFSRERDWEQFHHPKDLGLCLAIEVGEALEHFRFRTNEETQEALADPDRKRALAHELADCLWALLRLADVCAIDLSASLEEKVALAAIKYPADLASGRADKYTAYARSDEEADHDAPDEI
jgi:dCTP diphosphatase